MGDKNPKKGKKPKMVKKPDQPTQTVEKKQVPTVKETKAHAAFKA